MLSMKNISSFFSIFLFITASTTAFACGVEDDGVAEATETLSLQQSAILDINTDFNQYKQKQLTMIKSIAEELQLENFHISSSDMSASRSGQMIDKFDIYFSASLSYTPSNKAFTTFVRKMNLTSVSQYVYEADPCDE